MRRTILGIGIVLVIASHAWANSWCDGFYEIGIVPVFCDDWDKYCTNPDPNIGQCPRDGGSTANEAAARRAWPRTSVNYRVAPNEDGTLQGCGAQMDLEQNQSLLTSAPYGGRVNNMGDENGDLGQSTVSLVPGIKSKFGDEYSRIYGTDEHPLIVSFWMASGMRSAAGLHLSNGIVELALEVTPEKKANYLDREVAPTDYIMVGAPEIENCNSCYALCQQQFGVDIGDPHSAWPSICQSYNARRPDSLCPDPSNPDGPPVPCGPPYCPEVPADKIHTTIAIGTLAMLDPNPCHCELPPKPPDCPDKPPFADYINHTTMNHHLAFFDGWKWRSLSEGNYGEGAIGSGDFRLGKKYDHVRLIIRTSTVRIEHTSRDWLPGPDVCAPEVGGQWQDPVSSWADNIPRKYLGEFNVLRLGNPPSCVMCNSTDTDERCPQLNGAYDCKVWAGTRCHNMGGESCIGGYVDDGSNYVSFDGLIVEDGTPSPGYGACCGPDTVCSEGSEGDCELLGGRFQGDGTTCEGRLCCPYPFADDDLDGDVDQDDFGAWQLCYTGQDGGVPAGCECLNRNSKNAGGGDDAQSDIDIRDLADFDQCWSGPNVPWSEVVAPNCNP